MTVYTTPSQSIRLKRLNDGPDVKLPVYETKGYVYAYQKLGEEMKYYWYEVSHELVTAPSYHTSMITRLQYRNRVIASKDLISKNKKEER